MQVLKVFWIIIVCVLLTVLTQVGGVVYLLSRLTHSWTDRHASNQAFRGIYRLTSFGVLYGLATFLIVPSIAKQLGRVPLPLTETEHLQPLTFLTCLFNRNYVRPALKRAALDVAKQMHERFPGTTVNYLDANFPFWDRFPLLPHLSHHDGKKLDLSFCYQDAQTGQATNECPSWIGYGVSEQPQPNESNTAAFCANQGYWHYSILTKFASPSAQEDFTFDHERTHALVNFFAGQASIGKIFIEPHLKARLQLTSGKIRFHGCRAVRHDDHLHVQLK